MTEGKTDNSLWLILIVTLSVLGWFIIIAGIAGR